ncbi:hypothetical protein Patl1_21600 [Pistacia atlantica]|uniref:Uncharacterized protein n=1 Tax=Pistacia atlantica TaxID=434234 RepID=A0ACC1BL37_9ROSI|nr:hypothetical protein Patl1_21600 [Pistacia atlantica]
MSRGMEMAWCTLFMKVISWYFNADFDSDTEWSNNMVTTTPEASMAAAAKHFSATHQVKL